MSYNSCMIQRQWLRLVQGYYIKTAFGWGRNGTFDRGGYIFNKRDFLAVGWDSSYISRISHKGPG